MPKRKVLITVKTYPSLSGTYEELVCTAGLDENGNWVRIYPIPYRKLPYGQQYRKYDWVEVDLIRNTKDFRKESHRPANIDVEEPIKYLGQVSSKGNWAERKAIVLEKAKVYTNIKELIADAKSEKKTSLAVFKPTKILDFTYQEEKQRDWDQSKLDLLNQQRLFSDENKGKFEVVKKLPYRFKYSFLDDDGNNPNLMIEDWELGALYWKQFQKYGDELEACESVKNKFFHELTKRDLYFFLGTTKKHHNVALNPFIIIGVFYPKREPQLSMLFPD